MDHKDIRTLNLLEAVYKNGKTNQRALAEKLDISLGLANTCFRKLASAGYFKARSNVRGNVKYELTQKGAREKARLTYEYVLSSYALFKDARDRLSVFFSNLESEHVHRLVFCGVNDFAEMAYLSIRGTSLELVGVVDERKTGERFFGKIIGNPDMLRTLSFDRLVVTDPDLSLDFLSSDTISGKTSEVIFAPF